MHTAYDSDTKAAPGPAEPQTTAVDSGDSPNESKIRALADAIVRYQVWQQRRLQLREELKFKRRLKQEAAA
jgi:hypothetical protein